LHEVDDDVGPVGTASLSKCPNPCRRSWSRLESAHISESIWLYCLMIFSLAWSCSSFAAWPLLMSIDTARSSCICGFSLRIRELPAIGSSLRSPRSRGCATAYDGIVVRSWARAVLDRDTQSLDVLASRLTDYVSPLKAPQTHAAYTPLHWSSYHGRNVEAATTSQKRKQISKSR
jgi:hypothetical protein